MFCFYYIVSMPGISSMFCASLKAIGQKMYFWWFFKTKKVENVVAEKTALKDEESYGGLVKFFANAEKK